MSTLADDFCESSCRFIPTNEFVAQHREVLAASDKSFVLKVHSPLTNEMGEVLERSQDVLWTFIYRDPLQVFASGRDHYLKTGEFPHFGSTQGGVDLISRFFRQIYETHKKYEHIERLTFFRYEDLIKSPEMLIERSFRPLGISESVLKKAVCPENLSHAFRAARYRKSSAAASQVDLEGRYDSREQFCAVLEALKDVRELFGYYHA